MTVYHVLKYQDLEFVWLPKAVFLVFWIGLSMPFNDSGKSAGNVVAVYYNRYALFSVLHRRNVLETSKPKRLG